MFAVWWKGRSADVDEGHGKSIECWVLKLEVVAKPDSMASDGADTQ